VKRNKKI